MQTNGIYNIRSSENLSIPYLIYYPDDFQPQAESLPLVIFLHGGGERGYDPHLLTCHSLPRLCMKKLTERCIVVSPQCAPEKDWYYYMPFLMPFIYDIAASTHADVEKISLTGISMGAYGVWELAGLYPHSFKKILPICGGGMPWMADNYTQLSVWAIHGALDQVVPIETSIQMVKAINLAGGNAKLTIYPNVGHHAWEPAFANPNVLKWLVTYESSGKKNGKSNNKRCRKGKRIFHIHRVPCFIRKNNPGIR